MAGLRVDVVYENDAEPRAFDVTLHLPAGLTVEQVTRLERVAGSCPVRRALLAGFTFAEHTEIAADPTLAAA